MSDYDRNVAAFPGARAGQSVAVDAGLRAHMLRVYNYMTGAVGLTGVVAWATFQASGGDAIRIVGRGMTGLTPFGEMVMGGYSPLILMLATLGLVFFISFRIDRLQYTTALGLFMLYAALLGAALSTIFVQYTGASITQVFFISAASFGALSLYG
jgi:FtsH-binding integral membrane protein